MKKFRAFFASTSFVILVISILLVGGYFLSLFLLNEKTLKENEYGDFIGGVMNPFLTLLSTLAIIVLTYFIAKRDRNKTDETIATQKRLTLNQMRHDALNDLTSKLDSFAYQIDSIRISKNEENSFAMKVLSYKKKQERKENNLENPKNIWLGILFDLESFRHKKYLFENLFSNQKFIDVNEGLMDALNKLASEQHSKEFITMKSLETYLNQQSEFLSLVGNFILSEF